MKGWSTAHALGSILHSWCQTLDQKGSVRALFVDFSKAFDRVNYNIILAKLLHRDVPYSLVRWFYSYLLARCQCVRVDSQYSDWLCLVGGMPQGSVLGPLSFFTFNWWPFIAVSHPQVRGWHYFNRIVNQWLTRKWDANISTTVASLGYQ